MPLKVADIYQRQHNNKKKEETLSVTNQDLANFAEVLKEVWEPAYAEFLNNSDRTRAQFDSNSRGVVQGRYIKAAAHIGRNSGFAFLGEGEATPTAGHQSFMNTLVTAKKAIGRIKLTSEVIQDSATDTAAVADAMSVEKDGLGNDARREINFLLHAAGNGVIAACAGNSSSVTIPLAASTTKNVWRYLRDVVAAGGSDSGLRVTAGTVAAPTTATTGVTVTAVNEGAGTITVSSAIAPTSSHFIFRANQGGADGGIGQKVPSSLQQIISDTAPLYGADPASYPQWKSEVINAGNAAVTEAVFTDAFDEIDLATGQVYGNGPSSLIVTTHATRRALAGSFQDRVRYTPVELKGGFKSNMTIEAGGSPVGLIVDRDCLDNTAYLTTPSSITHVVAEDWNFVLQAGTPIQYNQADDSYNLLMRQRSEYMVKDRRMNAKITNLGPAE